MNAGRLLCLGYGYVARALSQRLAGEGWAIAGTARDANKAAAVEADGAEPVMWEARALDAAINAADAILISAPPGADGCPAAIAARRTLLARAKPPRWIGYLSTNGVYGDHDGAWVDETAELRGTSPRALARIAAENEWRAIGRETLAPTVIFRLPGIYGPGRSALDTVRAGAAQRIVKEGQVFSRAHVEDIASALAASLAAPRAGEIFNIADDEPAPPQDVIEFACDLLGVPPPPLIAFEKAVLSEMARSFYADNKRVSNAKMKARLSPRLAFPTYREGLAAILESERLTARLPG